MKTTSKKKTPKLKKGHAFICACGNRGYTALVNNIHYEGCPNYVEPAFTVTLTFGDIVCEGSGDTMLAAIRSIKKPAKITTKGLLTISHGEKVFTRGLTVPIATRFFYPAAQIYHAKAFSALLK